MQLRWSLDVTHVVLLAQCSTLQSPTQSTQEADTSRHDTTHTELSREDMFTLGTVARHGQEEHEVHDDLL